MVMTTTAMVIIIMIIVILIMNYITMSGLKSEWTGGEEPKEELPKHRENSFDHK